MRYTTDNHPFNIANDRVRQWVEKTGKADWKAAFKAVFAEDLELAASYEVEHRRVVDAGGRVIECNDPDDETNRRAAEYMKKHQGTTMQDAIKAVWAADPSLYQRYEQMAETHQPPQVRYEKGVGREVAGGEVMEKARVYIRENGAVHKAIYGKDPTLHDAVVEVIRQNPELAEQWNDGRR